MILQTRSVKNLYKSVGLKELSKKEIVVKLSKLVQLRNILNFTETDGVVCKIQ